MYVYRFEFCVLCVLKGRKVTLKMRTLEIDEDSEKNDMVLMIRMQCSNVHLRTQRKSRCDFIYCNYELDVV